MTTAPIRYLILALLALGDEPSCQCDTCNILRGYAIKWMEVHSQQEYRKDGGHVIEWRRPRQREAI